jgi:hypothetical protein
MQEEKQFALIYSIKNHKEIRIFKNHSIQWILEIGFSYLFQFE